MWDLKFQKQTNGHHADTVKLDCKLLVLAQVGVFFYAIFSILGSFFTMQDKTQFGFERGGFLAEIFSLIQCCVQTLFVSSKLIWLNFQSFTYLTLFKILNSVWRKCRGKRQDCEKPGRQLVTFLIICNICMWFIDALIKEHASFRPSHLEFFGKWGWTIITHISMPLAIFYRFHSTICLFDVWKSVYKSKVISKTTDFRMV